ncbi:MAG: hypothetical protein KAQ98_01680 [Bacteriovoracaceae bacterium]|nr:hypothetical protein [Bacteriovoracaceae bacterium]
MKALGSTKFFTTIICVISFAFAGIYMDTQFKSDDFMKTSNIDFVKRLDDSYERFVASNEKAPAEDNSPAHKSLNCETESHLINGQWKIHKIHEYDHEDKVVNFEDKNKLIQLELICNARRYSKKVRMDDDTNPYTVSWYAKKRIGIYKTLENGNLEIIEATFVQQKTTVQQTVNNKVEEQINTVYDSSDQDSNYEVEVTLSNMTRAPYKIKGLKKNQVRGSATVFIEDGKIMEISDLEIFFKDDSYNINTVHINKNTGSFSTESDKSENGNPDGGFISFNGNNKTFTIIFSTGLFQGATFTFKESDGEYYADIDEEEYVEDNNAINLSDEANARNSAFQEEQGEMYEEEEEYTPEERANIAEESGYEFSPSNQET